MYQDFYNQFLELKNRKVETDENDIILNFLY